MGVDWTQVLVVGVPAYIAAIFAGIAMLLGRQNRHSLQTSNGKTIAESVEATHVLATANAAALDTITETPPKE